MAKNNGDPPAAPGQSSGPAPPLVLKEGQRQALAAWIESGEDWLIARIIGYAKRQDYARYTSTLEEAWRVSIRDLSAALIGALETPSKSTEFSPDETFVDDPMSAFAVLEAERHRRRGTDLRMFLGLSKYYRETYLDWVREAGWPVGDERTAEKFIGRIFDRWEIAFCGAWGPMKADVLLAELQESNREITNEKNRFLTVTESLRSPVILFDEDKRITYVNQAAAPLLDLPSRPGTFYYGDIQAPVPEWLLELVSRTDSRQSDSEKTLEIDGEERVFEVSLSSMLDVSDKYLGTVVILHDITALHRAELALAERARHHEQLAITDPLTGLLNRRGLQVVAEKQVALALRNKKPLSVLFLDIDDLKMINDRYGHPVGDATIEAVAVALKTTFRVSDVVARVGGDEFVVLLPERGTDDIDTLRERIDDNLKRAAAVLDLQIEVDFSIGWAQLSLSKRQSFDQLIREADAAMYSMKRDGRELTRH